MYVCMSVRPSVRPSHNQIIRVEDEKVIFKENLLHIIILFFVFLEPFNCKT